MQRLGSYVRHRGWSRAAQAEGNPDVAAPDGVELICQGED